LWITIGALAFSLGVGFFGFKSFTSRDLQVALGVDAHGQFSPCPDKPNCVCSQAKDDEHRIPPLAFSSSPEAALAKLKAIIQESPRTEVIQENGRYLHATYKSRLFRYIDDVEFNVDPQAGVIQVKSASRVGHSDLGVNRKRIEGIRQRFENSLDPR